MNNNKNNKKELSDHSKQKYIAAYNYLVNSARSSNPIALLKWIKNSETQDASKVYYLNSIIGLQKMDPKLVKGNIDALKDYRDDIAEKIEKGREKSNLNPRQQQALELISYNDLLKFVQELRQESNNSYKNMRDYILVALMTRYPLRNDLARVEIVHHEEELNDNENVIYVPKAGKAEVSIKYHKTATFSGPIDFEIDDELSNDIRRYLKFMRQDQTYLFSNSNNQYLSTSGFTNLLNSIFMKKFGIPVSSTILRKIITTGKFGEVLKEEEELAHIQGHSVNTQRRIYTSNIPYKH